MCTVTFAPRRTGFVLGMNRDEKLSRAPGLPPSIVHHGARTVLRPSEPGGGTWIAVNNSGLCLALINWYSAPQSSRLARVSRGEVVASACRSASLDEVAAFLRAWRLNHVSPFRLIGASSPERLVREWKWDGITLEEVAHPWTIGQWCSSGYDEPGAQRSRRATFETSRLQRSFGSIGWMRRLHASHDPEPSPYSICMHRADARTISYTEVRVAHRTASMRYCDGPLCSAAALSSQTISC